MTVMTDNNEGGWDAALGMIDQTDRDWRHVVRLVAVVRAHQRLDPLGWAWLSYDDLAREARMGRNTVIRLLGPDGPMWRTWWVAERGPTGIGTRATAWALRPAAHWRKVPWLEPNREIREARIGRWRALDEDADDAQQSHVDVARQRDLAVPKPREKGRLASADRRQPRDFPGKKDDKDSSAARKTPVFARLASADGAPSPSVDRRSNDLLLLGAEQQQQDGATHQIIEAIEAKTQGIVDPGSSLVARIKRLARKADLALVLRAVDDAPKHYMPPLVVKHCESIVSGKISFISDRSAPAVDPLVAELADVEARIAVYTRLGEEVPQSLTERLADCQNRAASREEQA